MWERQSFTRELLSDLGLSLVYRGVPSDAGGPDYRDVILATHGGRAVSGDLEFHIRSSDWYRHGHASNPAYNRVILHVVWVEDSEATVRQDGVAVPVLALGARPGLPGSRPHELGACLLAHPCKAVYAATPADVLRRFLSDLGRTRFAERQARFAADLTARSDDQVIYTALMESLGYASNREVFRELADLVPFALIAGKAREDIARLLIGASGLLSDAEQMSAASSMRRRWRIAGLRPANHPLLRLQGLSYVLASTGGELAAYLTNAVLTARRPADLRFSLQASGESDRALIGTGRADEMAVSVVLPFAAASAPDTSAPMELFLRYPAPPANRWHRTMLRLLADSGHRLVRLRAPHYQGMQTLYVRYCRYEGNRRCPLCGPRAEADDGQPHEAATRQDTPGIG